MDFIQAGYRGLKLKAAPRIFAIWFAAGLLAMVLALVVIRPLAGLFFLIVVAGLLAMFVAPALHVAMRRSRTAEWGGGKGSPILLVLLILTAIIVVLLFSGWFNFA